MRKLQEEILRSLKVFAFLILLLSGINLSGGEHRNMAINQPLRVHPDNPRYFYDGNKGVYLGGHQIFLDIQDNSFNKEWVKDMNYPNDPNKKARIFAWDRYLDYLESLHFNYVRGWTIFSFGSGTKATPNKIAKPMMYKRVNTASDAVPKFDLSQFNESYFERMLSRYRDLQDRGIYISIMLFEFYGFWRGEQEDDQTLWDGCVFNEKNNINGIHADAFEFHSLKYPEVIALQKRYIEKVVDTVNELDNVIYEICNEGPYASFEWQCEMMRYLKSYEASKPKQHLVLLSPGGQTPEKRWKGMPEESFTNSDADCIAILGGWINKDAPKVYNIGKPVIMDLDHVSPGKYSTANVWKAFTRGYHYNLYDGPFEQPQTESRQCQLVRENIRFTRDFAERVDDIADFKPREDLSSTTYCLANEGHEYVVYSEADAAFIAEGLQVGQTYLYEWLDTSRATICGSGEIVTDAGSRKFTPPCSDAVLFLKRSK